MSQHSPSILLHLYAFNSLFHVNKKKTSYNKKWLTKPQDTHTFGFYVFCVWPTHFWDDAQCDTVVFLALQKAKAGGGGHLRKVLNDLTSQSHHLCSTTCFHSLTRIMCMNSSFSSLENMALTQYIEQQMKYGALEIEAKTLINKTN